MLTVGIDNLETWGTALVFSPGAENVVHTDGGDWQDFKSQEKVTDGPANLAMTHVKGLPDTVSHMERHDHTREALFSGGQDIAVAVCSSSHTIPTAAETELVKIPAGTAFVMARGTWHSPCFGLDGPTAYYWLAISDPRFPSDWVEISGGPYQVGSDEA